MSTGFGALSADRIWGVVLAGGLSRRMGRDKADMVLRGRSLLAHACERLAPQCAGLAINRHDAAARPTDRGYPIIEDGVAGRAGPLAGVLAGLEWTAARDPAATHVLTVAVDTPFLPHDLVSRLVSAHGDGDAAIVCAASGGRLHPVAALWPVAIRGALREIVVTGRIRKVEAILERFGFATAEWATEPHDPFLNVNTPDDMALAETVAAALQGAAS